MKLVLFTKREWIEVPDALLNECVLDDFFFAKAFMPKVPTKMMGGRKVIDYGKIPSGGTIWITIKKPDSPLRGRHIPITKRPDGKFAIDVRSAEKAGYKYGKWSEKVRAYSHMAFDPEKSRDEAAKKAEKEGVPFGAKKKAEAPAKPEKGASTKDVKQYKEKLEEFQATEKEETAKKEAATEARKNVAGEVRLARQQLWEELKTDTEEGEQKTMRAVKKEIASMVEGDKDLTDEEKSAFEKGVLRYVKKQTKLQNEANVARAVKAIREGEKPNLGTTMVKLPPKEIVKGKSEVDALYEVQKFLDAQEKTRGTSDEPVVTKGSSSYVNLGLGLNTAQMERMMKTKAGREKLVETWRNYQTAREEERAMRGKLRNIENLHSSEVEAMSLDLNLSEKELERMDDQLDKLAKTSVENFYDVLSKDKHWTADANHLYPPNLDGAASVLGAIMYKLGGRAIDTRGLIEFLGVEGATMALSQMLYSKMADPREFRKLIQKLEADNAKNQIATEDKALERYKEMRKGEKQIEKAVKDGTLQDPIRIEALRARNLLMQRQEMGVAYGSLNASASMLYAMETVSRKRGKFSDLSIQVGSKAEALKKMKALKLGEEGVAEKGHYLTRNTDGSYKLNVNTGSLSPYLKGYERNAEDAAAARETMDNQRPVDPKKDTPPRFVLAPRDVEQRNAFDYIRKHKGNPLLAASTGFGKTALSYGAIAFKLEKNPKMKAISIVPPGQVTRAHGDGQKFTTKVHDKEAWKAAEDTAKKELGVSEVEFEEVLPHYLKAGGKVDSKMNLVAVPEDASDWKKQEIIKGMKPGQTITISDTDAVKYAKQLERVGVEHANFDEGHTYLTGPGGRATSKGEEVQRSFGFLKSKSATTATPVKENLGEVYGMLSFLGGKEFKSRLDEGTFRTLVGTLGRQSNAKSGMIQEALAEQLAPHMYANRSKSRKYTFEHDMRTVEPDEKQMAKQKAIEYRSRTGRKGFVAKTIADWKKSGTFSKNFGKGERAEASATKEAERRWNQRIEKEHRENWHSHHRSAINSDAVKEVSKEKNLKTIMFVDSVAQRQELEGQLKKQGIKSMTTMGKRDKTGELTKWKNTKPGDTSVMFLSHKDATGLNAGFADRMRFVGSPESGAEFLQGLGRLDRFHAGTAEGTLKRLTIHRLNEPLSSKAWEKAMSEAQMLGLLIPANRLPGEGKETKVRKAA